MNRNIGSTDSVDTNQKQQRRPLAVPRSPYPGRSARRSGVSQKDKIESKFSFTRPTPLEISSLESVLTPNPPASPLESAFTKNCRGMGGNSFPFRTKRSFDVQTCRRSDIWTVFCVFSHLRTTVFTSI